MGMKSVSAFQESLLDKVISIDIQQFGGTISVQDFPSQYPFTWLQADPNGVKDLCTQIDESLQSITFTFKRSDNSVYSVQSVDLVGGRPVGR